jgi:hypothetical protein
VIVVVFDANPDADAVRVEPYCPSRHGSSL